ncbi:MAG: hypothetical protein GEV08_25025 [Acidimicrobiia bacterium]|nr:hypothetical protein [Acidimicrobiia bacterium]
MLAPRPLARLVASPARRCAGTLAPLAHRTGLVVETDAGLGPEADLAPVLGMLDAPAGLGTVACTHGEGMERLLDQLRGEGLRVEGGAGGDRLLLKGAAWELGRAPRGWLLRLHVPVGLTTCPHHG